MHRTVIAGLVAVIVIAASARAESPNAVSPTDSGTPPATAAPPGPPIAPGFWEGRVSALIISGRDRRCLRDADVERYVHGWSSHVYACTYPVSTVGDGHVVWHGACVSRGGRRLTIDATGD